MSSINSQAGAKNETTYGTAATVDRFWQVMKHTVKPKQYRADGEGLRASGWVERSDQVRLAIQGGTVDAEFEWMTKGMGWWLLHMLGTTGTTGPTDSAYTHTGTVGSLYGDFFTYQGNFPLHPAGTDQALTLAGCKIPEWEISCDVDGKVMFKPKIDARSIADATALASASYASGAAPYDWVDVLITLGGTALPATSWSIKCDNDLDVEKYRQQGSALHDEPTHKGRRKITVEFDKDFADLTAVWNRVRATVASSSMAQLVITITAPDTGLTIGAATQPSTTITIPKLRLDDIDGIGKDGPDGDGIMHKATGVARWDGTNSPITIAYVSADATA